MIRSSVRSSLARTVLAATAALAGACGSPASNTTSGESNIQINPVGTDQLSELTLQLPADSCLPGGGCANRSAPRPP